MEHSIHKQEAEVLQHEQAMEALMRHLPRLSTQLCPCPSVNMARAVFNREQVVKTLWPEYGRDARAVEAFVVVLSRYTLALWWCQRTRSAATTHIRQDINRLLAC
jgi:hypothetical protein